MHTDAIRVVPGRYRYPDTIDVLSTALRAGSVRELRIGDKQIICLGGPDNSYYRVTIERASTIPVEAP